MKMMLTVNPISDVTIVSMLAENHSAAWEQLYDKYASMMYGAVIQITKDERIAEHIFKECFIQLKETKHISKVRDPLALFLFKHAQSFTLNYLKLVDLTHGASNKPNINGPLMRLLSCKNISINSESKSQIAVEQAEARKKLREEFNHLRKQHQENILY